MDKEIIYPWWETTKGRNEPEAPPWLIDKIAELTKNIRTIHTLYVGFLLYCALIIIGTSDRQITLDEKAHLPILNVDVSFTVFVIVASLIGVTLFVYFQLQLLELNDSITIIRTNYAPLERGRLPSWVINIAAESRAGSAGKIQKIVANFSLWWLLPLVLLLISLWTLKKHDKLLSYSIWIISCLGNLLTLYFWRSYSNHTQARVEQSPEHIRKWRYLLKRIWSTYILGFIIISVNIFSLTLIIMNLHFNSARLSSFYVYSMDLSGQMLITERKKEYEGPWVDLRGIHLERANLANSVLVRANLADAHLQWAYLTAAQLQQANLFRADLRHSQSFGANFEGAGLVDAKFQDSWVVDTNLQGADLDYANFQNANLMNSNFLGATMREANLRNANLEGANLQGAKLKQAEFQGAKLDGVNFQGADLQEVQNITAEQLSKALSLYQAQLDPNLKAQLESAYPQLLQKPEATVTEALKKRFPESNSNDKGLGQ